MKALLILSDAIIPLFLFFILCMGLKKKIPLYETFVSGAKDGFTTVLGILPTLIGLMVAVGILRASGFLDFLCARTAFLFSFLHFPEELFPVTLVKMFSSSAATGLLLDLYKTHGTDSYLGKAASIMMSCTETIFYTMSVYLLTAKVQKSRYVLPGALLATLTGTVASLILAGLF